MEVAGIGTRDKEYILSCAEQSLKRLQTDCIDFINCMVVRLMTRLMTPSRHSKIKTTGENHVHYGISSIRPNVIGEYIRRSSIVSVMMQYSLLDRRPEETMPDSIETKQYWRSRTWKHSTGAIGKQITQGVFATFNRPDVAKGS